MRKSIIYCCSIFIAIVAFLIVVVSIADSNQTFPNYAPRPIIQVVNWSGNLMKIRFPYQDYKYILDYSNPYEYIETDAGYDLVIHFGRFERGES